MSPATAVIAALVSALFVRAAADVWSFAPGLAVVRVRAEAWRDYGRWRPVRLVGGALTCRFCLTFWVALATLPAVALLGLDRCWWLPWPPCVHFLVGASDKFFPEADDAPEPPAAPGPLTYPG